MEDYWYQPPPERLPIRLPRRTPKRTIPSYIGEPNLIACWLFNYTRGRDLYDHSPSKNHGTLVRNPEWRSGSFGWGLYFDGTGPCVEVSALSGPMSEFTVIWWARHDSVSDGDVDNDFQFRLNNGLIAHDLGDGTEEFMLYDGAWNSISTTIENEAWVMWTMRYDGTDLEGIKNQPPSFDSVASGHTAQDSDCHAIGAAYPAFDTSYLDGMVALVWIYDVAKPDSFVERVFQETRGIFGV